MYLVIAEKPSVSKAIAEVIGASKKEEGYLTDSIALGEINPDDRSRNQPVNRTVLFASSLLWDLCCMGFAAYQSTGRCVSL